MGRLCLGSVSESHPGTAKRPEPLCRAPVLPPRGRDECPPGRALPLRRRSYGLMRQTSTLHSASALPRTDGLCRLLPAPAGPRTFPTLSLPIFLHVSGPLLRLLPGCIRPLLPPGHWPSPRKDRVGATHLPDNYFRRHSISKLQSFANLQTRRFARHAGSSHRAPTCTAAVASTSAPIMVRCLAMQRTC